MTFAKKDENINKIFEIQKVICINYKCGKENCINNGLIKNKKIKRKKNLDGNILSSIKEEEDNKIKKIEDLIKKNKKEEKKEINNDMKKEKDRAVSAFGGGVRNKYLSRFHKK